MSRVVAPLPPTTPSWPRRNSNRFCRAALHILIASERASHLQLQAKTCEDESLMKYSNETSNYCNEQSREECNQTVDGGIEEEIKFQLFERARGAVNRRLNSRR